MRKILFHQLLALILFLSNSAIYAASQDTAIEKNVELEQVTLKISELQKTLSRSRNRQNKLNQELAETEIALGQLAQELTDNQDKLTMNKKELDQIKKEIEIQENNLQQQQALLAQQLKIGYQLGRNSPLKIMLNQNDPSKMSRLLSYYGYLNQAREEVIQNMLQTVNDMSVNKEKLAKTNQELNDLIEQTQKQQQALIGNQQYRQTIIQQINQDIDHSQNELKILQANKDDLEKLIERLNRRSTRKDQTFKTQRKKLPWPISGSISENKNSNAAVKYPGMLIKANSGTPIYAIYDGQVKFANWLRGYGLLIIIDHGDGYMSLYGHNESLYAKIGDQIQQGDLIARVGNSGGNQQEGLYFEIRHNGKIVNPNKFLK